MNRKDNIPFNCGKIREFSGMGARCCNYLRKIAGFIAGNQYVLEGKAGRPDRMTAD
jgi:hypothetical protein